MYTVWFALKPGYCWEDGTNGTLIVTAEILKKTVTLEWTDREFTYDGKQHAPKATVTNLAKNDVCNVGVVGAEVDAGTHDAQAAILSNENYTLDNCAELTTDYVINPTDIEVEILTTEAPYGETTQLKIKGYMLLVNVSKKALDIEGDITFSTDKEGAKLADIDGDMLTPKKRGVLTLSVHVDATKNTNATTSSIELTIVKGKAPLGLETDEAVYGTDFEVVVTGNNEGGELSYAIKKGADVATLEGNVLTPLKVGTVTLSVTVTETENFKETTKDLIVKVLPKPVKLEWFDLEFTYDAMVHAPKAKVVNLVGEDKCDVFVVGGQINAGTHTAT